MLNKKENLAAVSRFKPVNKPPVIVTPDLDEPGTSEKTCAKPISRESRTEISFISFLNEAAFSAIANITANTKILPVITYKFLVSGPSISSFNNSPSVNIGIEPMIINQPNFEFCD